MQINFAGSISQLDTKNIRRLARPSTLLGCFFNRYLMLFLGFLFWFIAVRGFLQKTSTIDPSFWLSVGAVYFIIAGAQFLPNLIRQPRRPESPAEVAGSITDDAVTIRSGEIETSIRWKGFIGYRMVEDTLLLFTSEDAFYAIPRDFFSSRDDWNAAVLLARSRVSELAPPKRAPHLWFALIAMLLLIAIFAVLSFIFRYYG